MPQKRRARNAAATSNDTENGGKPKKRRVSLACNACRAAREKCDGARPECRTCISQQRSCSYTPATKKRGVQTGYLRAIELSLAWIFEQMPECEEKLLRFLSRGDRDATKDTRALLGKGSAGHHLQRLWNRNRVRKAIDGLLSDAQINNSEDSGNDLDTDGESQANARDATSRGSGESVTVSRTMQDPETAHEHRLRLPKNWKRLLDVYVSYTHCWLPIVNLDSLRALASSYPSQGISICSNVHDSSYLKHSELWAVLAIAAYQDEECTEDAGPRSPSISEIFDVSRTLIPADDGGFDIHSINAMIIHSVILIGKMKTLAASILLGKSARFLQRLRLTEDVTTQEEGDFSLIQLEVVSLACSFLDVLTSVFLHQHPMRGLSHMKGTRQLEAADFAEFDQPWVSVPEISATSTSSTMPQHIAQPIRTITQLHAFASVMSDHLTSHMSGESLPGVPGPEVLVKILDSRFNYCNSLISSGSTPIIPSAYLVKLLFLTATIELTSDSRSSLLSGFLEIVESCFAVFGAGHTPPVVVLLLQIVQRRADADEMGESGIRKWRSITERMQNIWREREPYAYTLDELPTYSSEVTLPHNLQQITFTPMPTGTGPDAKAHARSQPGGIGVKALTGLEPAQQLRFGYQDAIPNPAFAIDTPITTRLNSGSVNTHTMFSSNHRMSQNFDYDAILEDFGSIGYTDNMEMDTQFMTNLGFAPGCDLAEIFQGDWGV
ncbi:hypothetical protein J3458_012626 [Metarhizium acridum]|uniref:Activator n=1 Tax=Metarhizium acridum (strain CQMa 102) TaxID=655827 RepID=E9E3T3_METAQ|nr:activator [Metarhizium acridum CQMa 102]EFY89345.1 activator [Metarhizium acridum CQMa 102]KAG8413551.1 hypothetical protein J3458_012626 [Metarhizium acridum]